MKEKITAALLILLVLIASGVLLSTPSRPVVETVPPTTEETVPQTTPPPVDALPRVAELLERNSLSQTAVPRCIYDDTLHHAEDLTGADIASPAHALARLSPVSSSSAAVIRAAACRSPSWSIRVRAS